MCGSPTPGAVPATRRRNFDASGPLTFVMIAYASEPAALPITVPCSHGVNDSCAPYDGFIADLALERKQCCRQHLRRHGFVLPGRRRKQLNGHRLFI